MEDNVSLHDDPRLNKAWAPYYTHEYITYYATLPHQWLFNQDPVKIQPNPEYGGWEIGPNHVDLYKESAICEKILNPDECFDCEIRNGPYDTYPNENLTIEPWKVLFLYSTEPDLHLDCDLDLHWSQKLTKGSHGYRHMRFSLFGKKFGCTNQCLEYYLNTAKRAKIDGNSYWYWRFNSRATHYLADLGHPFHTKTIPYSKMLKYFRRPKKLIKILSAVHSGHEVFAQKRFREGFLPFKEAIITGSQAGFESQKMFLSEIEHYRQASAKLLTPMFNAIIDHFGDEFADVYDHHSIPPDLRKLDYSKQTTFLENRAQAYLFADSGNPGLQILDELTEKALYKVGFMFGLYFKYLYHH